MDDAPDDAPDVLVIRASDRDDLIYAASHGDTFAVALLAAISQLAVVASRGGGVPCCRCRAVVRRKIQRTAFAIAHWPDGDLHRAIFCERCASHCENDELREAAITTLLATLQTEWASARGSTFVARAGTA